MSWIHENVRDKLTSANASIVSNVQSSISGLHNRFWKKEVPTSEEETLSLLGVDLTPNKRICYIIVEDAIDKFVGDYLPERVERFYRLVDEVHTLKHDENQEESTLLEALAETSTLIQDLHSTFCEVQELKKLMLRVSDLDYFNLSIDPAKKKMFDATQYFFACNTESLIPRVPHTRSPKARDLLSLMQKNDDDELLINNVEEEEEEDDYLPQMQFVDHAYREIPESFLKHQQLVDFYTSIVHLHELVTEDDGLSDNISGHLEQEVDNTNTTKGQKVVKVLKAAALPTLGAVVGGVVAGPVGLMAGLKIGSYSTALAATAGLTGSVVGYKSGKLINKKHNINTDEEDLVDT